MTSLHVELPPLAMFNNFALSPDSDSVKDLAMAPVTSKPKFSLAFILDDNKALLSPATPSVLQLTHLPATQFHPSPNRCKSYESKLTAKEKRSCSIEGCNNYTIDRGLCYRHGGGKSCSKPGCTASAKHRGVCWKHGGSTLCSVEDCTRGAKSRGLCWSHGGGSRCSMVDCQKPTISKGLCWTHGGGKRCTFDDCKRPALRSLRNFCSEHRPSTSE